LYATDGSERAEEGARFLAARLPLGAESVITVMSVAPLDQGTPQDLHRAWDVARQLLKGSSARLTHHVRSGPAAETILVESREEPTDLIVLGDTSRSGSARRLLGGVSDRVARHAHCSVLIARPLRSGALQNVVVGFDGSREAERALRTLVALPLPPTCRVHLVTVVPSATAKAATAMREAAHYALSFVADELKSLGRRASVADIPHVGKMIEEPTEELSSSAFPEVQGRWCVSPSARLVRIGDPTTELLAAAEEVRADLIVVGARGQSPRTLLLGSVSERILRNASCSVLCVRSEEL
jgi:nucleotide-binding universal stress UspA family protein